MSLKIRGGDRKVLDPVEMPSMKGYTMVWEWVHRVRGGMTVGIMKLANRAAGENCREIRLHVRPPPTSLKRLECSGGLQMPEYLMNGSHLSLPVTGFVMELYGSGAVFRRKKEDCGGQCKS